MPYTNVPDDKQDEMERCVQKVVADGNSKESAIAICHASIMGKSANITPQLDTDELIYFGDSVKALGDGKVGGYLVRYGDPLKTDLTGDYFEPDTFLGVADTAPVYYQHGMDAQLKRRVLSSATLTRDEVGVWAETQLKLRDEYERQIYRMVEAGKMGWSSGSARHLVDREQVGNASKITAWPIIDASLTPTPAEWRNSAVPLKSLILSEVAAVAVSDVQNLSTPTPGVKMPTEEEIKGMFSGLKDELLQAIPAATKSAVKEYIDQNAPEIKATFNVGKVTDIKDPADSLFESIADQMRAVKNFEVSSGRSIDPRLKRLEQLAADEVKANGMSEGIPSDGGFLLEPTLVAEFLKPMHEEGPFTRLARRLPVGTNSNYGWINGIDETSRATGSRWGGVRGYRLAEADTKTASKPKFRRITWELKKYAVIMYATDELLQDSAQLSAIINESAAEELSFMANDDILNGQGIGGPLGILNSPALISILRTDANNVLYGDIINMWQRMLPRSRGNAAWFINSEVEPELDVLYHAAGTDALPPNFVTYGIDGVMRIKGRPVYVTEFNSALGTAGDILLADMNEYLMWEKGGVQAAQSIHVQFLTDETTFRFVYRCDGQTSASSALTPYKGTNTQSAFVTLSASS